MLSCIPDVSLKTAERILMNFNTINNLINTLLDIPENERVEYIQNLPSKESKFRKISVKSANNIIKFLF